MPAVSKAQKAFMGADLGRAEAGQPTVTGMDPSQLGDFASTPAAGLPATAPPPPKKHHHKKAHAAPPSDKGRQRKGRGGKPF